MDVAKTLGNAQDALTVNRVFAEPYEKDGVSVIAAAAVSGAGGAGAGGDPAGEQGEGGGFRTTARPAGAYVVKDGQVSWRPAVDVNRIITVLGVIAVIFLLRRPRRRRA